MAVGSLGQLTLDLVANTAGFERGMDQAERATAKFTKESKRQGEALERLVGQIDPVAGALNRLDAQQQKLDAHFKAGRLPVEDYTKYTAVLNQQKAAAESSVATFTKLDKAYNAQGLTAKQLAANLRGVPAQFTDIAVSLQAGQAPLTVLLQQGGQLKDMFGGIGPAAKALGGYVVGLINPFTVAAAAAAALAVAYKQGSDETTAFSSALAITGNTAGTTSGQLSDLAQKISLSGGTVGKASAVLAQLAASTKIPKESFEQIAVAALAFEKATGQAAEETVKNFEKIAKDPTAEILKLNESMNFLTAATYEQIKALQEQGNVTAAAQLANAEYESGLERTATSVQNNLGAIEKGWNAVKGAAKSAWDAALNIGRQDTLDQQLKALDEQLNQIANTKRLNKSDGFSNLVPNDDFRTQALEAQKTQLLVQKAEDDRRAAAKGFAQQQQAQALNDQLQIDKLRKDTESNADKREKEIGEYRLLVERRVASAKATGDKSLLISAQEQARQIAAINDKYKDPKAATPKAYQDDAGQKMLATLREQAAALQLQSETTEKLGAQAQALAKFNQQIADIKNKDILTADQKSLLASQDLIRAQLNRNVALEQEVAARKQAAEEAGKLAAFQENQQSKLANAQDGLNSQLAGVGMGDKARERLKEDLAIRKDYADQMDKLNKQLNTGQISQDLYKQETDGLQEALAERLVMQEDYYNQVDELNSNFFLGVSEAWANYADEATNYQQQAADATSTILGGLTTSIADNLESLVKGQESIGDFFKNIAADLANSIIGALVKMAAQWLVYQGVQLLVGATTSGAAVAEAAIAGPAIATAYAPAAALASLASFGANSIPATAALITTTGVAQGLALTGMAHDGIDSVPADGTWLLQKGERVTTAQTSAKLDKTLNDIKSPSNMGGTTVNLIEDASRAGQTQERTGDQGEQMIDVFVADLLGDGRTKDAMSRKFGLQSVGA